jgi:hypothetical protein
MYHIGVGIWSTEKYRKLDFEKSTQKFDVGHKNFLCFEVILVLNILHLPHTCRLTCFSIGGPFFTKLAMVENFKDNF